MSLQVTGARLFQKENLLIDFTDLFYQKPVATNTPVIILLLFYCMLLK